MNEQRTNGNKNQAFQYSYTSDKETETFVLKSKRILSYLK